MSDTPRTDELPDWEHPLVQEIYKELCDQPVPPPDGHHWEGWAAQRIVQMFNRELAAATALHEKRLAELNQVAVQLSMAQTRIAELETLLREVLRQGCEYHTKKYALLQMDHALIQEIADAIAAARKEGR